MIAVAHVAGAQASVRADVRIAGDAPIPLSAGTHRLAAKGPRQMLTITVVLKRTDQAGFDTYLQQVYDRHSPQYRHFLTQAQLADRFGPSMAEYRNLSAWLASMGFRVVMRSSNRLSLTVRGTRAQAERAFDTPIRDFRVGRRAVYANVGAPAVPRSFGTQMQAVMGLSNRVEPAAAPADEHYCQNPGSLAATAGNAKFLQGCPNLCLNNLTAQATLPGILTDIFWTVVGLFAPPISGGVLSGAGVAGGYCIGVGLGSAFPGFGNWVAANRGAFGLLRRARPSRAHAAGPLVPKIGLAEFDTYRPSDVTDWVNLLGIDPRVASRLSEVNVNGGVASPGPGEAEVLLDIDTVLGGAPLSTYVVYDAPQSTSFVQMFQAMIADHDTVISNSWSQCEDQTPIADARAVDSILASAAASGITTINGSGDAGSTCLDGTPNTVGVPADSPNAVAVGGTTPTFGPGLSYGGESWWDDQGADPAGGAGGFGVSRDFDAATYQRQASGSSMRSVPDLSFVASPHAGMSLCRADAGGCPDGQLWGGTSMSAPAVAALFADLDQRLGSAVGNPNPTLYALAGTSAFHSAASMGTDFAHVGLGSPDFNVILQHLTGTSTGAVSAAASQAAATGQPQADGSQQGLVRVDLADANGFPVGGKQVTITPSPGSHAVVSPASATTDATGGSAAFTVTDTTPETVTFTVSDASDAVTLAAQPAMTFVTPTATGANIVASPSTVVNDGNSQATITVYLENALGRPAAGKTVSLSDNGASATISPASGQAITDAGGLATFTASDTVGETVSFTATDVSDSDLPVPGSATVNFAPAGPPNCGQTLPAGSGGFSVSPFASGLGTDQQAIVTNVGGLTFTTPACDGAETPVFDPSGNVYVPDDIDGHIYRFGPGGGTAGAGTALPNTTFAPNGQLDAIAFGKNGELWATTNNTGGDNTQPEVLQLDPQTGATERVVATRASGLAPCPQYNVAVDPLSGDVFTGDDCGGSLSSGAITRVHDPGGPSPTVSTYTTEPSSVVGIAFAPDGTMYVVQCGGSPTCTEIDSVSGTNGPATPASTRITNLPNFTVGLAVASTDSQGHATALEAADDLGNVYRITLTQNPAVVTTIASGGGGSRGTVELQPVGVGPDGCLYVARADTVYKVSGAGCGSASAGPQITLQESSGSPTSPTGSPVGLTASLQSVPNPAGTPVHFTVVGPNSQPRLIEADGAGQALFDYAGVFEGVDTITASASVGGRTITSAPVQVHWTAGRNTTFLSLNATQPGGIVGHPATISAELLDITQSPPAPVAGATVALSLGSSACTAATNAAGIVSCAVTPTTTGLLPVTATFGGDTARTTAVATDEFDSFKAVAPQLTQFKVTPKKFRAAKRGPSLPTAKAAATAAGKGKAKGKGKHAAPPTGTTITYVDSLPATTTLIVQRVAPGVRKGKRCVAPPRRRHGKKAKRARHCVRYVAVARVVHVDRPGKVAKALPGVRQGKRCVAPPAHRRRGKPKPKRCTRVVQAPITIVFDGRVRGRKLAVGRYRVQAVAAIDGLRSRTVTARFSIVR